MFPPTKHKTTKIRLLLQSACLAASVSTLQANNGGGFINSGITGTYYANTSLSGSATFTRNDVRVDFNWGATGRPGGSSSPGYSSLASNNFSVLWSGQIIPRFSETYTFKTVTTGGVTLKIQPVGGSSWTTLVNDWTAHSATTDTGTYGLMAGGTYNIQVQYFNNQPSPVAQLHWSSPSTAEEAIEPATPIGINAPMAVDYDQGVMFADAMKMARLSGTTIQVDGTGWPSGDGSLCVFAGQSCDTSGLYTVTFNGSATVTPGNCTYTNFSSSYNSNTNTTKITFVVTTPTKDLQLNFSSTRRNASDTPPTGVTNLQIMRPLAPGNTTASCTAGQLFYPAFKGLMSQFTVLRFMDYFATNTTGNNVVQWTDRLLPAYSTQQGNNGGYQGQGGSIEYAIEACNETGRDLWMNIPVQANNDFITKLAQGIRYGFNASGLPYTSATATPAYPPLNSNLRVYLEYSNETWNFGFNQQTLAAQTASALVNSGTGDGLILKFDGSTNSSIWTHRWVILRSKEISDLFRGVWGDAAMMTTVRPLFMYQYDNTMKTASDAFQFIDNYFNNSDGISHVTTPHPVNYFFYGGGGGWYNSVVDSTGTSGSALGNGSFESPVL
ncbi:MAG: PA14 domain-containing protein, partial [Verrucomicrobiota bacterium]